jgi:tetratricopeptide (TPR) repeat protein
MNLVKTISCVAIVTAILSAAVQAQPDKARTFDSVVTAAQEAQARNDFSSAAAYYRQAVKLRPGVAELWANLGLMNDLAGNPSEAVKSFSEAARLNASIFVPQLFLGIDYLKLNRPESAIPFLQKAEQINSKDPQAPLALGRAFALSGKGDRSSDAYMRALDISPDDGNAWLGLGMAELQQSSADDRLMTGTYKDSVYTHLRTGETFAEQGRLNLSSDAYASVLAGKVLPAPPCAHASYGFVLMRQQELSKARVEFEKELRLNPGCNLAELGVTAQRLKQGDTDGALKRLIALWHRDRGFLQENLSLLRDVLSDEQREQLMRMTQDLEANEKIPPAESAPKTQPSESRSQRAHEIQLYSSGQYQKCAEALRPQLGTLPEVSLSHLAFCAFYTGDFKTASLAARRLKSIPATRASGLYWESNANQKLAVAALSRAGETASNSPQLHILLGDIYRQRDRWDDAESEYQKALAVDPHNEGANLGLGLALFASGKKDEALAIDRTLLTQSPDHPEANLLAGEILVRDGHYTDAEAYLKKIHDSGQKFMLRVHTLLGEICFATDRYPQALIEFRLGQVSDDDGSVHYQLGRTYQKLGDRQKAEDAFRVSKQLREHSDDRTNLPPQ